MSEHTQLDLAVIGRYKLAALFCNEGLADLAARFGAHRNVLQVRVRGGKPSRGGCGQRKAGVHAARIGVDRLR
jgi:hypothetical protein